MTLDVDRSLRLPEYEYFAEPQAKSGIALHHTVCDSARTTLTLWRRDKATGGKLRKALTALQDSVTKLVSANADAYRAGQQAAYAGYQDLSKRYVAELKKPGITFASTVRALTAAGLGLLIGRAVK